MKAENGAFDTGLRRAKGRPGAGLSEQLCGYGLATEPADRGEAMISGESEAVPENDPGYAASEIQAMLDELKGLVRRQGYERSDLA